MIMLRCFFHWSDKSYVSRETLRSLESISSWERCMKSGQAEGFYALLRNLLQCLRRGNVAWKGSIKDENR